MKSADDQKRLDEAATIRDLKARIRKVEQDVADLLVTVGSLVEKK